MASRRLSCTTRTCSMLENFDGIQSQGSIIFRGLVLWNEAWVWRTSLASAYPVGFGQLYAALSCVSLEEQRTAWTNGSLKQGADQKFDEAPLKPVETWQLQSGECAEKDAMSRWKSLFVESGGGAPRTLTREEHLAWGSKVENPLKAATKSALDPAVVAAIRAQCQVDPLEMAEFWQAKQDE